MYLQEFGLMLLPTYVQTVICVLVDVMADILHDEKGLPGLMGNVTVTKMRKFNI